MEWAVETFHPRLTITTSMTDAVLVELVVRVEPSVEVGFIDTGWHFPETLETLERVRHRYVPNLALAGRDAWMSGLRRTESASRAGTRSSPAT